MTMTPEALRVHIRFKAGSLQEACRITLQFLQGMGLQASSWEAPIDGPKQTGDLLEHLGRPKALGGAENVWIELVGGITASVSPHPPHWACEVVFRRQEDLEVPRHLALAERLCASFASEAEPITIILQREAGGAACLPWLPYVGRQTHAVLFSREQLGRVYEDVDAFIACWQVQQERHGRLLLSRAMKAITNVEFLSEVIESQWAMARIAKPKLTKYELFPPEPEEEPIYRRGEPRVLAAGYDEGEQIAEYTCYVEPDEHIHGWEIDTLAGLVRNKQLGDGRPLQQVRVVFADEAMARRERRPLLDNGVVVRFYDANGELKDLVE